MKTNCTTVSLSALLLFFFFSFGHAQISLTSTDLNALFSIGNEITVSFDSISGTYNVGTKGGGNSWDFSQVSLTHSEVQMVVAPGDTPFSEDFSAATLAIKTTFEEEGVTGEIYNYHLLSGDVFAFLGNGSMGMAEGSEVISTTVYSPGQPFYTLPVSYEDTWTYEGVYTSSTTFDGTTIPGTETDVTQSSVVDAYGQITFPDGTQADALRIKETRQTTSEIVPGFPTTFTSVTFVFVTKSGAYLSVSADAEDDVPDEGEISGTLSYSRLGDLSSTVDLEAEGFRLHAPLTHPVINRTMIRYTLPDAENIRLSLYDLNGREVKVLHAGRQAAGDHQLMLDRGHLPGGAYFLSLRARKGVLTQKIIIQQ